jgi:DNA-directed RNA polymerase subunit RPC12/RpoP
MADIMAKARRSLGFDVRGLEPGMAEEVTVGAYARREFRRRMLIGAFGGALIVGALTLYGFLKPPGQAHQGGRYAVRVRCASCGHTAAIRVRFEQSFPMRCPECGQTTCRVMWQCRDCGHAFVPEQAGPAAACPECGSVRVGSAAAP